MKYVVIVATLLAWLLPLGAVAATDVAPQAGSMQATTDIPSAPLTVEEAARIALRRNPGLVAARAAVEGAKGRTDQAKSLLFPTLGASGTYAQAYTLGGSGSSLASSGGSLSQGWQGSVSVRQLAWDFEKTRSQAGQAAAEQRATSAGLTSAESDLVLQVKLAFFTLVQDERLVQVNQANLDSSKEHLALARARETGGFGLPVDVSRAEAALSAATLQLTIAQNAVAQIRVSLAALMGIDPRTPYATAGSSEKPMPSEDGSALVDTALKRRPEVLAVRASVDAAILGERSARVTNAPSLYVSAGMSAKGNDFPPNNSAGTIGVSVSWSPFDSGLTAGRIREARAGVDAARAQLVATQQAVIADVTQAMLNLRSARQRVTTADSGVKSAEDSLRLAEGRYRAGVGTFIDVTDAQNALVTARAESINARAAVDQAQAALKRATGEPVR